MTLGPAAGSVVAACRTHAVLPDAGRVGSTGIDKRPVDGALHLGVTGVEGDSVRDERDHGGPDKAVYAYAREDIRWWESELGRKLTPGMFGENLLLAGVDVTGAVVGERWRIGKTVLVEVTQPRTPCMTFQRFLGEERWVRRFFDAGRPGAYLRVLEAGAVRAGDPVVVSSRPEHGVTLGRWFTGQSPADAVLLLQAEAEGQVLAPALISYVELAARRG